LQKAAAGAAKIKPKATMFFDGAVNKPKAQKASKHDSSVSQTESSLRGCFNTTTHKSTQMFPHPI
jgi:hypothetical protein